MKVKFSVLRNSGTELEETFELSRFGITKELNSSEEHLREILSENLMEWFWDRVAPRMEFVEEEEK